jgi:hypothetical protein
MNLRRHQRDGTVAGTSGTTMGAPTVPHQYAPMPTVYLAIPDQKAAGAPHGHNWTSCGSSMCWGIQKLCGYLLMATLAVLGAAFAGFLMHDYLQVSVRVRTCLPRANLTQSRSDAQHHALADRDP